MANYSETGRYVFELFGHVLAQKAQSTTARRASVGGRQMDLFIARQVVRQRLRTGLLRGARSVFRYRLHHLAFIGLQILQ